MSWASTSGLRSRLRSDVAAYLRPRIVPALGFASCRVAGPPEAGIPTGLDPDRIINLRGTTPAFVRRSRAPQSAHGFSASFPTEMRLREDCSASHIPVRVACWRRGSPSLQRIDGADALPTRTGFETGMGKLPV